jgi:Kdo2-lipid IVA lauroyltransferase/acyltransferase
MPDSNDFKGLFGLRNKFISYIAHIPYRHIAAIGGIVGLLIYYMDVRHRRIVRRNLSFVYPDWPAEKVKETSRRIFRNLGITLAEICQLTCFSAGDILEKVNVRGEEHLLEAMDRHRGVVLISAHLGNWEIVPLFWPLYFKIPVTVIARELDNGTVNRWITRLRSRFGGAVIYKEEAMSDMIRTLRQDKALAILVDQGTRSSLGVKIKFFDKYVTATSGAALLAMRCRSPVLPGFCVRNGDGTFTLEIGKPLSMERTGDLRADLEKNTQAMTDAIEAAVRAYPEQWFWVHKRWRKYYPHLYPEDIARRKQRRMKKNRKLGLPPPAGL